MSLRTLAVRSKLLAFALATALAVSACPPANDASNGVADVTLPGLDTTDLLPRERHEWSTYVTEMIAPCPDVAVPIAQCVRENRPCDKCMPAAKMLLKAVRDGMSREKVEQLYRSRYDASQVKRIDIAGSPSKGPHDAPVVMVEFADFECPFCATIAPQIDQTWEKHKTHVLFVFKLLPLTIHRNSEIAARAAIAAGAQGKFWEMHQKLFAMSPKLERRDLDGYAKELGLDMTKFAADFDAPETTQRITADRALADSLKIRGTPSLFINGRQYDSRGSLDEWIEAALSK